MNIKVTDNQLQSLDINKTESFSKKAETIGYVSVYDQSGNTQNLYAFETKPRRTNGDVYQISQKYSPETGYEYIIRDNDGQQRVFFSSEKELKWDKIADHLHKNDSGQSTPFRDKLINVASSLPTSQPKTADTSGPTVMSEGDEKRAPYQVGPFTLTSKLVTSKNAPQEAPKNHHFLIDRNKTHHPIYQGDLLKTPADHKKLSQTDLGNYFLKQLETPSFNIKRGEQSFYSGLLQDFLKTQLPDELSDLSVDLDFGTGSLQALQLFQEKNGLSVTSSTTARGKPVLNAETRDAISNIIRQNQGSFAPSSQETPAPTPKTTVKPVKTAADMDMGWTSKKETPPRKIAGETAKPIDNGQKDAKEPSLAPGLEHSGAPSISPEAATHIADKLSDGASSVKKAAQEFKDKPTGALGDIKKATSQAGQNIRESWGRTFGYIQKGNDVLLEPREVPVNVPKTKIGSISRAALSVPVFALNAIPHATTSRLDSMDKAANEGKSTQEIKDAGTVGYAAGLAQTSSLALGPWASAFVTAGSEAGKGYYLDDLNLLESGSIGLQAGLTSLALDKTVGFASGKLKGKSKNPQLPPSDGPSSGGRSLPEKTSTSTPDVDASSTPRPQPLLESAEDAATKKASNDTSSAAQETSQSQSTSDTSGTTQETAQSQSTSEPDKRNIFERAKDKLKDTDAYKRGKFFNELKHDQKIYLMDLETMELGDLLEGIESASTESLQNIPQEAVIIIRNRLEPLNMVPYWAETGRPVRAVRKMLDAKQQLGGIDKVPTPPSVEKDPIILDNDPNVQTLDIENNFQPETTVETPSGEVPPSQPEKTVKTPSSEVPPSKSEDIFDNLKNITNQSEPLDPNLNWDDKGRALVEPTMGKIFDGEKYVTLPETPKPSVIKAKKTHSSNDDVTLYNDIRSNAPRTPSENTANIEPQQKRLPSQTDETNIQSEQTTNIVEPKTIKSDVNTQNLNSDDILSHERFASEFQTSPETLSALPKNINVPKELKQFVDQGLELIKDERYDEALKHFTNRDQAKRFGFRVSENRQVLPNRASGQNTRIGHANFTAMDKYFNFNGLKLGVTSPIRDQIKRAGLDVPESTIKAYEREYALLSAEEWTHSMQHVNQKPVSVSGAELALSGNLVYTAEEDVISYMMEKGIPLPDHYFDRYHTRDPFKVSNPTRIQRTETPDTE